MKLRWSDNTRINMVLLEVTGHPSALDNALPGKKGNDNIMKSAPPLDMRNRGLENTPLYNDLRKLTDILVVNENLHTSGEMVKLL